MTMPVRKPDNSYISNDYRLEQGVGPLQDVKPKSVRELDKPFGVKVSKKDLKAFKKEITKKRK